MPPSTWVPCVHPQRWEEALPTISTEQDTGFNFSADNQTLTVTSTGSIRATGQANSGDSTAERADGLDDDSVENSGSITGSYSGVYARSSGGSSGEIIGGVNIDNSGSITGGNTGIGLGYFMNGTLTNAGDITGGAFAIDMEGCHNMTVVNTGTITSTGDSSPPLLAVAVDANFAQNFSVDSLIKVAGANAVKAGDVIWGSADQHAGADNLHHLVNDPINAAHHDFHLV